jgi:hypothetical protein
LDCDKKSSPGLTARVAGCVEALYFLKTENTVKPSPKKALGQQQK